MDLIIFYLIIGVLLTEIEDGERPPKEYILNIISWFPNFIKYLTK